MGDTTDGLGDFVDLNRRDHGAIIGSLLGHESVSFLLDEMLKAELLEGEWLTWNHGDVRQSQGIAHVALTFKGWERYEELKRGAASGNTAFIAMEYGNPELDPIVEEHFRPAVSMTGFTLQRLDERPQAGLIDDRLRNEIRACRFLIADLSHGNRGAPWEAGYAEGLDKPVIYTCRKDVFDDPDHPHHPRLRGTNR